MKEPEKKGARILVSGMVQGVCFRYYTRLTAERLGLVGYVRNLSDGGVEIVAEGETEQINRLADWARRGPSSARVTGIKVDHLQPRGAYRSFNITG